MTCSRNDDMSSDFNMTRNFQLKAPWRAYADAFEGEMLIWRGEPRLGLELLRPALATLRSGGFVLYDMAFRGIAAGGLRSLEAHDTAATELDAALTQCKQT